MRDPTLLVAFAAGVLSLISPCSALLLPAFFAYAFDSPVRLLGRTTAFYVGLLLTLVPLGIGGSFASTLFYGHRSTLISVSGWVIIVLGIVALAGRGFTFPMSERFQRLAEPITRGEGWISTVALGAVYGLAGFCSGPILGSILTVAATRQSSVTAAVLLAAYGLGMAAPLFVMALLWDRYDLSSRRWLRGRAIRVAQIELHTTQVVSGLLFIVIGVLFLISDGTTGLPGILGLGDTTDFEMNAQSWLADNLGPVPTWVIPAVIAAGAALVLLRQNRTSARRGDGDIDGVTTSSNTSASGPRPGPDSSPASGPRPGPPTGQQSASRSGSEKHLD